MPPWSAGASSGFLQFGQLYLIGGRASAALSSLASMVRFRLADAAGSGFGWVGTWIRCEQLGQFFFVPASLAGASNGVLQRGQLYLIGGDVSPSMVLA